MNEDLHSDFATVHTKQTTFDHLINYNKVYSDGKFTALQE